MENKLKKNVLILGSGGREHAFAWALAKDENVEKIYCVPGNGGTEEIAENVNLNTVNHQAVIRFVEENDIDLTIVGPEAPLAAGMVDSFVSTGMRIFGPDAYCAQLESSKLFARDLMAENKINHPDYYSCNTRHGAESLKEILKLPLVLKADGLAAGKGVIVCHTEKEFEAGLKTMFDEKKFGKAGARVCLERCLIGEELSVFAVCEGKDYIILNSAQDHKRAYDGDKGPNTGGMGAYSPTPLATPKVMKKVGIEIIQPTLNTLVKRGHPFRGFLYAGLMIVKDEIYVIEFNVRMGDPETQAVLPLLNSSLFELLWNATEGKLAETKIKISNKTAVAVVLAAKGYPESYKKGLKITGLDALNGRLIFHAGTKQDYRKTITYGGRVLNAVGLGKDLPSAIEAAYEIVDTIDFNGKFYRKDIGERGLQYLAKE